MTLRPGSDSTKKSRSLLRFGALGTHMGTGPASRILILVNNHPDFFHLPNKGNKWGVDNAQYLAELKELREYAKEFIK